MGRYHPVADIIGRMRKIDHLRNVAFVGHIDHGKTTLSDSLLAEAGLLSESLVGDARALDYLEEEQRRGITMKSANVSLYYDVEDDDEPFIINLVDTPGHLDFSGKVTRALRLVDGVVVIVDAVEEINSQSEIVLKQALEEGVKPILFINKVDRLFREIKLTDEEIKEKFSRIIEKFNRLIDRFKDSEFESGWNVSAENGTVIFGSALHKWGFTIPKILQIGWTFKDISEKYVTKEFEDLKSVLPVWESVLSMIIKQLPNPLQAQQYRIKKIWNGDLESELGKNMRLCNPDGPLVMCMSNIKFDSNRLIATGRIFSGTLKKGQKVHLVDVNSNERILKVALYMGARLDDAGAGIPAGNIAAVVGLKEVRSGESIVEEENSEAMTSFESVKYVSEPVVTVAIEPEMLRDLKNLQVLLDQILIEDPNLNYFISNDTGEVLLSGMGPLHLEIAGKQIEDMGMNVTVSKPMSVFRESIAGLSSSVTGKSPSGNIEITLKIQRNDLKTVGFLRNIKATVYSSYTQIKNTLKEHTNLTDDEADGYLFSDEYGNLLINMDENIEIEKYVGKRKEYMHNQKKKQIKLKNREDKRSVYIKDTTISDIVSAIGTIFFSGPLCGERLGELKITIEKLQYNESDIEEGDISKLTPLLRKTIFSAIKEAKSVLLEPIYKLVIQSPPDQLGGITSLLSQHQARITNVEQYDEFTAEITAFISVREYINFSTEIRSITSGRAFWQTQFYSFEQVPENRKETIVQEIKFRKGIYF